MNSEGGSKQLSSEKTIPVKEARPEEEEDFEANE